MGISRKIRDVHLIEMHSRKLDGYKIKVVVQIIVSLNERSVYDHKFMIVIHDGV